MELRIKETIIDGEHSFEIESRKHFLFINYWSRYLKITSFFDEYYVQEFVFDNYEKAARELSYLKAINKNVTVYHY